MSNHAATALLAGLLVTASPAVAQNSDVEPAADLPSPRTARALSTAGTLVPLALVVGGIAGGATGEYNGQLSPGHVVLASGAILMVAGPSLGYFYGGQWLRGLASTGMRIAGLLALPLGVAVCWTDCTGFRRMAGGALFSGGLTLWLGSTYNDITQVEEDVRRANARQGATLEMAPVMDIGARRVGLAVRIRR